jgi:photosystem II stability/assembly factor-like uncharacterized protein
MRVIAGERTIVGTVSSPEPRAWRALGAVGLAVMIVLAVGAAYLRPWQQLTRPAPAPAPSVAPQRAAQVRDMQFLSANLGWVVTEDAGSSTLLQTADGGRHWRRQLVVQGGQGRIVSFRFFDARHGVVYSFEGFTQVLRRTGDGGQHWTSVGLPRLTQGLPSLAAPGLLFFADPDHGWCLVTLGPLSPGAPIVDRQDIALFRTVDGGATWREMLRTDDQNRVSHGLGDDGWKMWIQFRDLRTGWIGQTTPGSHAAVYATVDGGEDWTRQELASPTGGWGSSDGTTDLTPPAVSRGGSVLLGAAPVVASAGDSVLLGVAPIVRTGNGWIIREQYLYVWAPAAASWSAPMRIPGAFPATIEVVDGRRWWAAGGTDLLVSDDAGDHWRVMGQAPTGLLFVRFAVADVNRAWALLLDARTCQVGGPCRTSLGSSADGGRHWATVSVRA